MTIEFSVQNFDLWVFRRNPHVEYLLLKTSAEKAERFFNGGIFWQIPTDSVRDAETIENAATRVVDTLGLNNLNLWAAEHTYTIYNRRRKEISIIPVFAAEVVVKKEVTLTWEHSDFGWFQASECHDRLSFRGLKEGLTSVREYITEVNTPATELKLL